MALFLSDLGKGLVARRLVVVVVVGGGGAGVAVWC